MFHFRRNCVLCVRGNVRVGETNAVPPRRLGCIDGRAPSLTTFSDKPAKADKRMVWGQNDRQGTRGGERPMFKPHRSSDLLLNLARIPWEQGPN